MRSPDLLPHRSLAAVVLFCVLGSCAVFFVPFHIPVAPAVSDSFAFGFNNRAALVLFVAFAGSFAYWSGGLGLVAREPEDVRDAPAMSRRLLIVTMAVTLFLTLAFWAAYRDIGAINEGSYLFDRLQHLAAGEHIYRDFEFIYGPILLYFPLLLHRLLRITLLDAYFFSWTVEWVLGIYLLWFTVAWASRTSPRKNGIYLLMFLSFIFSVIGMGVNYTPLRFVAAPFIAVVVWRTLRARRPAWWAALIAIAGSAWLLFYSPEQGIAFTLGSWTYFAVFVDRSRRERWTSLAFLLVGDAVVLSLFVRTGVLRYVRGMAQGGYNLPLLPSVGTLMTFATLLVGACLLVNAVRLRQRNQLLCYLVLIACFALPAAFGRCDGGHLFMNTLGVFIAAWTVVSFHRAAGKWMVWSFVIGALGLPLGLYQSNNFFMFPVKAALLSSSDAHPTVRRMSTALLLRAFGPKRADAEIQKWRAAYPIVTPSNVPAGQRLLAPLGYPSTLLLEGMPPATNGRYRGLGNVMTSQEVREKIQELQSHPKALLLFTADASCPVKMSDQPPSPEAIGKDDRERRRQLFLNLLPFYIPPVRNHGDLLGSFCRYVSEHYQPSPYTAPLAGARVWWRSSAG